MTINFIQDIETPHNNCLIRHLKLHGSEELRLWYAEDIKSSKIKSDDPVAFCSGLVRQDPYLFTFNKGKVAKYLKENEPQSSEPKSDKKKETK